jgi:cytochrome c oxidase subunit 2
MSFKYLQNLQKKIISALLLFSVPMKADWFALNMTRGVTDISNEVFELHMLIFLDMCCNRCCSFWRHVLFNVCAHQKEESSRGFFS